MRITHGMIVETTLRNMQRNMERTERLQAQITSGSRITKASDDPIGAARALTFQESLDQTDQYLSNISQASAWLNTSDGALDGVTQVLSRARELAVQASNGTASAQDRAATRTEIQQLQQQALTYSRAKYGSYHLFSGTRSDQPGYVQSQSTATTPSAYQGDARAIMREISPGVSIQVNTNATQVFDPVFNALDKLEQALGADSASDVKASIGDLDNALDATLIARAEIGSRTNRLEFLEERLQSVKVNLAGLLSEVKDVDMAEALTNFSMAQVVYEASLKASAQAIQPSLLDYLR
jgi:flagellar hook-associated protein 3 FlgL